MHQRHNNLIYNLLKYYASLGKNMETLDITLHGVSDKSKSSTISILIQWHEDNDSPTEENPHTRHKAMPQGQRRTEPAHDNEQSRTHQIGVPTSNDRMLPSDQLVLNALRARVPRGVLTTKPVRIQELMDECAISRRQVQICLKRLTEKGIVKRLSNEATIGSQEGCRYKVSREEVL
jgi:hypothetical protein